LLKKKRRKFTAEFKDEAVKLALEQGYTISETARSLLLFILFWRSFWRIILTSCRCFLYSNLSVRV